MKKIILIIILFFVINILNVNANQLLTSYYCLTENKIVNVVSNNDNISISFNNMSLDVSNLNDYKNIFLNKEVDNYPTYLVFKDNSYILTNENLDADNYYIVYSKLYDLGFDSDSTISKTCSSIIGDDILSFLNDNVFKIIHISVPIILIVLTSWDFAKVVFFDDKDGIQYAFKRFSKRSIAAILIFFVPSILTLFINIIGISEVNSCVQTVQKYIKRSE